MSLVSEEERWQVKVEGWLGPHTSEALSAGRHFNMSRMGEAINGLKQESSTMDDHVHNPWGRLKYGGPDSSDIGC